MVSPPESPESVSPPSSPPRARIIRKRDEPPPLNRVRTRRSRILAAPELELAFASVEEDPSLNPPRRG